MDKMFAQAARMIEMLSTIVVSCFEYCCKSQRATCLKPLLTEYKIHPDFKNRHISFNYVFPLPIAKMSPSEFQNMCSKASTAAEIYAIVEMVSSSLHDNNLNILLQACLIPTYHKYIGWALPSKLVCSLMRSFWEKHSYSTIYDVGAGSGLFCMLFHEAGIPKDKLVAIDLMHPPNYHHVLNNFWCIQKTDGNFQVPIDDILFVAWGAGTSNIVHSYIARGGRLVVILGEIGGGCTFPSDFLEEKPEWSSTMHHVQGPASNHSEFLSFNTRLFLHTNLLKD